MRICLRLLVLSVLAICCQFIVSGSPIIYMFNDVAPSYTVTGTISGIPNGDGSYTITSGSGVYTDSLMNHYAMTLYPNASAPTEKNSPSNYFIFDNQLFPTRTPMLDLYGLLFTFKVGSYTNELNIWNDGGEGTLYTMYVYDSASGWYNVGSDRSGTFTIGAVPEPATLSIGGLALIACGYAARRPRRVG